VRRRLTAALMLCVLGCLATCAGVRLRALPRADPLGREVLFLPTLRSLELMSMGNRGLTADILYLWALQRYSIVDPSETFLYLDTMFNLITDLDPLYCDAYNVGALLMEVRSAMGVGELGAVKALYRKGVDNMPTDWTLAEAAAWDFYHLGDVKTAVEFATIGASRPGAPHRLTRVLGVWRDNTNTWTVQESINYWLKAIDGADDASERRHTVRHLYNTVVERDRQLLNPLLERFRQRYHRCPASWDEVVGNEELEDLAEAVASGPLRPSLYPSARELAGTSGLR
jgi:hypothetical protein